MTVALPIAFSGRLSNSNVGPSITLISLYPLKELFLHEADICRN
jgi:hypothetical protein